MDLYWISLEGSINVFLDGRSDPLDEIFHVLDYVVTILKIKSFGESCL